MADLRWLDPTIDPNGRRPGTSFLGEPQAVNFGPTGLARFTTTRSWLSQWSYDDAQIDAVDAAPRVSVPVLMLVNGADDAVPVPHSTAFFAAVASQDKERVDIPEANHYFAGAENRSHLGQATEHITDWAQRHGFN